MIPPTTRALRRPTGARSGGGAGGERGGGASPWADGNALEQAEVVVTHTQGTQGH